MELEYKSDKIVIVNGLLLLGHLQLPNVIVMFSTGEV
jgi:hypothetical protein